MTTLMIGDWRFAPGTGILSRGREERRLEHRAGRVLALLHARAG